MLSPTERKRGSAVELNVKTFGELSGREVYEILKARMAVFMMEQNIRYLDMDDTDYDSLHLFYEEGGKVTAYLRAYKMEDAEAVHIGRVLTVEHGKGLGGQFLTDAIEALRARTGCQYIRLDAQTPVVGFYEKSGFRATSGEFLEAGIPHIAMELEL